MSDRNRLENACLVYRNPIAIVIIYNDDNIIVSFKLLSQLLTMTSHPSLVLMITINVQRYLSFIIYAQDCDDNINVREERNHKR